MPHHPILNPAVHMLIQRKVQAMRRSPTAFDDPDDLSQHLLTELLRALPNYDPQRGPLIPFAERTLQRVISRYRRAMRTKKRSTKIQPLIGDMIADPCTERERQRHELRLILEELIPRLSPTLRDLAQRLMRQSPAEVSRDLQIPSSTLRDQIAKLRQPFENHDLRKFL